MKVVEETPTWRQAVVDLRARTWPDNRWGRDPRHLAWRFDQAPLDQAPLTLLAVEGDDLLGMWAGLPTLLWSGQDRLPAVWMVDLVVAPEHRDTMAAMALFRAAGRTGRTLLATGATTDTLDFYRVFRWQRRAIADTFFSVRRPGRLLAMSGRPQDRTKALAALADRVAPWAGLRHQLHRQPVTHDLPRDVEIQDLFERVRHEVGVIADRSPGSLRWKLDGRPCGHHRLLSLRSDGRLRGMAILKLRARPGIATWGELVEVLVPPSDGQAFDILVNAALRQAHDADLDFVRFRCALPAHTTRLRRPWWLRRVRTPTDDLFLLPPDPQTAATLARGAWHLSGFDSDAVDTGIDEWEQPLPW